VQKHWKLYKERLRAQLTEEQDSDARLELSNKIAYMEQTDMVVVISDSEDDSKRFAQFEKDTGEHVDITIHHQRFQDEKLAENFKNAEHPLRIAFVCSMWMTGFDVPCLSTIYLNRKLEGHTLMQTIARANRVFKEKTNGLIVDYASTIHALEEALATYAREDTSGQNEGDQPVGNKSELVQALRDKLVEIDAFCQGQGIDVQVLRTSLQAEADKEQQQELVKPAIDRLVAYEEIKLNYLILAAEVRRLYKAILPDAAEKDFTLPVLLYRLIEQGIYSAMHTLSVDSVLSDVTKLVRSSITLVRERTDRLSTDTHEDPGTFDISQIDINALDASLHNGYRHIKAEQLRNLLSHKIRRMIQANKTRIDYQKKLQRAVDRYNEGCENQVVYPMLVDPKDKITLHPATREAQEQLLDELDDALVELVRDITQEEQRHTKEGLSEEELALFDILTLNVSLSQQEQEKVKQVVRQLLDSLRLKFVLEWYKKAQTLSQIEVTISRELDELPQVYTPEIYHQKCAEVLLHVQEYYRNDGTISAAG
jgi:type I restriction enzyme R subunit